MIFRTVIYVVLLAFPVLAIAEIVDSIIVKGNKIIESSAIRSKLSSQTGKKYKAKKVQTDVRVLFRTGWFDSIMVEKKGGKAVKLIYTFKEKPIVEKVIYKGQTALSKKDLEEASHFSSYEFLDHRKIQKMIENIRKEYEKKAYYLTELHYSIKPTKQKERVHLVIHIKENKKTKVKKVQFSGNHSISSQDLKSFMGTREDSLLSFITSSGTYSKDVLEKDLNNIRFIYMDRGYWRVAVEVPELIISKNKTDIQINIPIKEGEQYKAGQIEFSGDLIFDKDTLRQDLETEELEVFSYGKLQRDIKKLETKYGNKGYAFVNIIPQFYTLPTDDKTTINVMFEIQKGKPVKLGKIHILGNSYTRDKVIRREIRIYEGELYNATNKAKSVENIQRLGFFDEVVIIPKTIKDRDDLVDMEVMIKERENTGVFQLGVGYDGYRGFTFNGKLQKMNLFGKGYTAGIDTTLTIFKPEDNIDPSQQYVNVNFSDPYFLDSNWYFAGDFYLSYWSGGQQNDLLDICDSFLKKQKELDQKNQSGGFQNEQERTDLEWRIQQDKLRCHQGFHQSYRGFTEQKIGAGVTVGRSITDSWRLFFQYELNSVKLTDVLDKDLYDEDFANGLRNPVTASVEYDKRNDRMFPTKGLYFKSSLAYDGLFSKFNYLTSFNNIRFYQPLFWDIIFRFNLNYNHHISLDKEAGGIPFDRLFVLGGINELRGFEYYTIGPRYKSEYVYNKAVEYGVPNPELIYERVTGGERALYSNIEIQFPIIPSLRFSGVIFLDIGTAYNDIDDFDLRLNWGIGARLISPIGPIRVELGLPFAPREKWGEKSSEFQFTIGLPF